MSVGSGMGCPECSATNDLIHEVLRLRRDKINDETIAKLITVTQERDLARRMVCYLKQQIELAVEGTEALSSALDSLREGENISIWQAEDGWSRFLVDG